jgi:hypothetical protein
MLIQSVPRASVKLRVAIHWITLSEKCINMGRNLKRCVVIYCHHPSVLVSPSIRLEQRRIAKHTLSCDEAQFTLRWDNQLPQQPCVVPQQFAPFHCLQLLSSLFGEGVVLSYRRPTIWAIRS